MLLLRFGGRELCVGGWSGANAKEHFRQLVVLDVWRGLVWVRVSNIRFSALLVGSKEEVVEFANGKRPPCGSARPAATILHQHQQCFCINNNIDFAQPLRGHVPAQGGCFVLHHFQRMFLRLGPW